jgi:hypothetical protein
MRTESVLALQGEAGRGEPKALDRREVGGGSYETRHFSAKLRRLYEIGRVGFTRARVKGSARPDAVFRAWIVLPGDSGAEERKL